MTISRFWRFLNRYPSSGRRHVNTAIKTAAILSLALFLVNGCAFFSPVTILPDPEAEEILASLQGPNAALSRFKGIGQVRIFIPEQPVQTHRIAVAGEMADRLRIDLISPVGGSAATFSSDGRYFFIIRQTPAVEYHKKKVRPGLFRRLVGIDVQATDLLKVLSGQIPVESQCVARMSADRPLSGETVNLVDRKGRVRQRIVVDSDGKPVEVVWFDGGEKTLYTLHRSGEQKAGEFVFPRRVELFTPDGHRLVMTMDRYFPDATMDDNLFRPSPLSTAEKD